MAIELNPNSGRDSGPDPERRPHNSIVSFPGIYHPQEQVTGTVTNLHGPYNIPPLPQKHLPVLYRGRNTVTPAQIEATERMDIHTGRLDFIG